MEPKKIISVSHFININITRIVIIIISLLLLLSISELATAQRIWIQRKGCFRSQGNLGGGYFFKQKAISGYLNGEMELFLDERFAYTGAISYSFLMLKKNETGIQKNHAVYAGANYHFIKSHRCDPYIGLTPGIGMVKVAYRDGEQIKSTPYSIVPLLSAQVGCNFYICSFLHFFLKVQGITGQVFSTLPAPQRLDELKMMGGMGLNFRVWKPKEIAKEL